MEELQAGRCLAGKRRTAVSPSSNGRFDAAVDSSSHPSVDINNFWFWRGSRSKSKALENSTSEGGATFSPQCGWHGIIAISCSLVLKGQRSCANQGGATKRIERKNGVSTIAKKKVVSGVLRKNNKSQFFFARQTKDRSSNADGRQDWLNTPLPLKSQKGVFGEAVAQPEWVRAMWWVFVFFRFYANTQSAEKKKHRRCSMLKFGGEFDQR